jgi:hypothetical protein
LEDVSWGTAKGIRADYKTGVVAWIDRCSKTSIKVMLLEPGLQKSVTFFRKVGIHATTLENCG